MSLRFSMRTFAVAVTLFVMGLAGVMSSRPLASNAVYTLNWILMCLSLVAALVMTGDQRRFWIGFAVFSWCYWVMDGSSQSESSNRNAMVLGTWTVRAQTWNAAPGNASSASPPMNPAQLLSGVLIDFLESQVHPQWRIGDAVVAQFQGGSYYPGVVDDIRGGQYYVRWTDGSSSPSQWTLPSQIQPGTTAARVAANSLICSLWGLVGGLLATLVLGRRELKVERRTTTSVAPTDANSGNVSSAAETNDA